jgi:hypothetical protein
MNIVFQHKSERRGYILLKGQEMIMAHGLKPPEVVEARPGISLILSSIITKKVPENPWGIGIKDLGGQPFKVGQHIIELYPTMWYFTITSKSRTIKCRYANREILLGNAGRNVGVVFDEGDMLVLASTHKEVRLRAMLVFQRFEIEFNGTPFEMTQQLERQRGGIMEVGGAEIEAWGDVLYAKNKPVKGRQ